MNAAGDRPFEIEGSDGFTEFFGKLFSTDFMPHGHCYWWKPNIIWLNAISDIFIALAYFSIPLMLFYFIRKRRDISFWWVIGMFGAFILCCGTTHVLGALTLWYPVYRLEGVVKALTAAISVATALVLFPLIPRILQLRTPQELELEIAQRIRAEAELRAANEKLRETERLKDEFIAGISHELRTPLTLIASPLQSALQGGFGEMPPRLQSGLALIERNTQRLLQLVGGLLDFSKLQAGKFVTQREPTNVATLAGSLFADFEPLIKSRGLQGKFINEIPDAEVVVSLDRYLFERIVFNLLSNAVKFNHPNGTVNLTLRRQGERLSVAVADSGIGISPAAQASLFQKFHQVESAATRRFEGTGLGLSLVREFALLLGGNVTVESEPGRGSLFTVDCAAPAAVNPDPTGVSSARIRPVVEGALFVPLTAPLPGLAERVLVAEDNGELASYIASILSPYYDVRVAGNVAEAQVIVARWPPDIILSDVMMPGKDGYAFCRELKSQRGTLDIPVVLVTALTHRVAMLTGWEAGADDYLFKPFHPHELLARVRTLVKMSKERRRAAREIQRREELEQFTHLASHDLKEPIRTIITFSQLLERKVMGQLDANATEYLQFVVGAGRRIHTLMQDLVEYARMGEEPPLPRRVALDDALASALQVLQSAIEAAGAEIDYGTNLPAVLADRSDVAHLIQNLLSNSLKFARETPLRISIGATLMEGECVVTVQDNGMGFPQEYAEYIFTVFKRLHPPEKFPGTGIGLALCRRIVQRYGGKIWATSGPGGGATFQFTLPAAV